MRLYLIILMIHLLTNFSTVFAGKIVVNHDEWTLSNSGIKSSSDGALFAQNVAEYFTGGSNGSFLGYTTNFSLTGSLLSTALNNAGHRYATDTNIDFSLSTLLTYDGLFLAGNTKGVNTSVLVDYVKAGGNVYLAAGTAQGFNATSEAAFWNTFLKAFDLAFAPTYNRIRGDFSLPNHTHQIFSDINSLYHNNGNTVMDTNSLVSTTYYKGLYGVYDSDIVSNVSNRPIPEPKIPEPKILWLLLIGLFVFILSRRPLSRWKSI